MRTPRAEPHRLTLRELLLHAIGAVGCAVLIGSFAVGQETNGEAATSTNPPPTTTVKEPLANSNAPDTTVWVDDNGVPRLLVDVTYEEFFKAWRAYKKLVEQASEPQYTLNALLAIGVIDANNQAAAEFDVTIDLQVHEPGRVAVPIRFRDAIFTGEVEGLDANNEHLAYDEKRGGYVLWLQGAADAPKRTIRLRLLTLVSRSGDSVRLSVSLPRSPQSEVDLIVDGAVVAPAVSEGVLLSPVSTAQGGTRLPIRGAVGPTRITYRTPSEDQVASQAVLKAVGQLSLRIGDRSIRSMANLTVDGLNGSFDRFLVRLPSGATPSLDSDTRANNVRVKVLDPADLVGKEFPAGDEERLIVEVSRADASNEPLSVRLVTETPVSSRSNAAGTNDEIDLAGFEVLGADWQLGDVAVSVDEGVQLDWGDLVGAVRIEPSQLPEALAESSPPIAVRYWRNAWRLPVSIASRTSWIEAKPTYHLEVLPEELRLSVDTRFRVFGSVFELAYELNGWEEPVDDLEGPVGLIDPEQPHKSGTRYVVPLTRSASRRPKVVASFERSLPDAAAIDIRLPTPVVDALGATRLVVTTHPSIELSVDTDQTVGLEPVAVTPDPNSDDDPAQLRTYAYRTAPADTQNVRFVAKRHARPGRLEATSDSVVTLTDYSLNVDQVLEFHALYQPIENVLLWAPRGVDLGGNDTFELAGESTPTTGGDESTDTVPVAAERVEGLDLAAVETPKNLQALGGTIWRVELPGLRSGVFRLRTRLSSPRESPDSDAIVLPLLRPLATARTADWRSSVEVVAPPGKSLTLADNTAGWEATTGDDPQASRPLGGVAEPLQLVAGADAGPLRLELATRPATRSPTAMVRRVWFQTWDAGGQRQTRAAYLIDRASSELEIELPEGVSADKVEILLDGSPVALREIGGGRLAIVDDILADGEEHTITTRRLEPLTSGYITRLAPVRVVADTTLAYSYWELVQPANQHVATTPDGFANANIWGLSRRGWGRQPTLSTADLARETGADVGLPLAAGEHRYLLTRRGVPDNEPVVRSVSRSAAVLTTSGVVLAVVFGIHQLGLLRWRATYYVLTALVASVGAIVPGPFVLVLQAGAIGLVLAAVTLLADRLVRGPYRGNHLIVASQSTSIGAITLPESGEVMPRPVSTNAPTVSVGAGEGAREAP